MGADDHALHQQVCVAQVCEGLVVLSLGVVVEHFRNQPGVGGVLGSVDLWVCGGVSLVTTLEAHI